jgi:hypothetical protein
MTEIGCSECKHTGYLLDQGYGCAEIPEGWIPVQACDACCTLSDEKAAQTAAAHHGVEFDRFESQAELVGDEIFDGGPGDWAIKLPTPPPGMRTFKLEYTVTELRTATVFAESESAARQMWIDDFLDLEHVEDSDHHLERVYEEE